MGLLLIPFIDLLCEYDMNSEQSLHLDISQTH